MVVSPYMQTYWGDQQTKGGNRRLTQDTQYTARHSSTLYYNIWKKIPLKIPQKAKITCAFTALWPWMC